MTLGLLAFGEESGAFDHDVHAELPHGSAAGPSLTARNLNFLAIHDRQVVLGGKASDFLLETSPLRVPERNRISRGKRGCPPGRGR